MSTVLLVILILLLLGALPLWPYSSGWGYYPSGGLGLLVLILIILSDWPPVKRGTGERVVPVLDGIKLVS
jgi:hypothetical protein